MHSLEARESYKETNRNDEDFGNLIRAEIFVLFSKVKSLIIQSTHHVGSVSFSFSLIAFLSVIDGINLDEIIIKSVERWNFSWIKSLWKSDEQRLKKAYSLFQ